MSQVFDEEDLFLVDLRLFDFAAISSARVVEIGNPSQTAERVGAYRRAVMELHFGGIGDAHLAMLLKIRDVVDESGVRVWFGDALRMAQCDDVGGGFFDDEVTGEFEVAEDGSFAASGSAGEDVSFHWRFVLERNLRDFFFDFAAQT